MSHGGSSSNTIEPSRRRTSLKTKGRLVHHEELGLDSLPTSTIYEGLADLRHQSGRYEQIAQRVEYLVTKRGVAPDLFLYETLILANTDTRGSAAAVANLLDEMASLGIQRTPSTFSYALQALAIHPNYTLRGKILDEMKTLWMDPTPSDQQNVALGLLRDGQYELALDAFERLVSGGGLPPPAWFYDVFLSVFGERGFHDEALKMLQRRVRDSHDPISPNAWHHLLEVFGRAFHYDGTAYVWGRMVDPSGSSPDSGGRLQPSDGTVLDVLNTAARHGDPALATEALQVLSARNVRLSTHHFEALLDSYVARHDVVNALRAVCIMAEVGVAPDARATARLRDALARSPPLRDAATRGLFLLRSERAGAVPLPAFNVVLEATAAAAAASTSDSSWTQQESSSHAPPPPPAPNGDMEAALHLYRSVRQICGCAPDLATFTALLVHSDDAGTTAFLTREMAAFDIVPDRDALALLARCNARHGDVGVAFTCLEQMERGREEGVRGQKGEHHHHHYHHNHDYDDYWLDEDTAEQLARRAISQGDERVGPFVDACDKRGMAFASQIYNATAPKPRARRLANVSAESS